MKLRLRPGKGDVLLMAGVSVLLVYLYIVNWTALSPGASATILINAKPWKTVPLSRSQTIEVPGKLGTSRIEISQSRIRFVDSPCQTKRCVLQGWVQYGGELAACLPNRVSIQIKSAQTRYDSINF